MHFLKETYELYFGQKIGGQDKAWAPQFCCANSKGHPENRYRLLFLRYGENRMIMWRTVTDHVTDCDFCLTNDTGFSAENKNANTLIGP